MPPALHLLNDLLTSSEEAILQRWIEAQTGTPSFRSDRISRIELDEQAQRFLGFFRQSVASGSADIGSPAWANTRHFLEEVSISRAHQGFSPSETAAFVLTLKEPLFALLRGRKGDAGEIASTVIETGALIDRLALFTTEVFQRGREQVIIRQQQELMELSTPVVTLWEGVLALPIIGTLDSARTQVVMESLLQRIVESGAAIAIIDITGVPTVDTLTAQHLLKTVAAARLMGADCIISGIRPQIAQTIVHLGVELGSVVTKATLADAFAIALRRLGLSVTKMQGGTGERRRRDSEAPDSAPDGREA
jgi:rsbT co-antagonist protein RsbR